MIHFTNRKGERLPEDINKVANERYVNHGINWLSMLHEDSDEWKMWVQVYAGNYAPFYRRYNPQARKAEIIAEIEKLQNELNTL